MLAHWLTVRRAGALTEALRADMQRMSARSATHPVGDGSGEHPTPRSGPAGERRNVSTGR